MKIPGLLDGSESNLHEFCFCRLKQHSSVKCLLQFQKHSGWYFDVVLETYLMIRLLRPLLASLLLQCSSYAQTPSVSLL
ncbi:Os05g0542150 [Oryza sativa Japonica Group]|uniref:Os05g0542150 protein n=1 Tax=Oryza sativa subsp. japonica TaxID=39947 RepID=A0A0P0WPM9_ORYSJ|nr:hypothetical protein EE612_030932 [Oryza sativa]BAS95133.1 Os05g0542150 [Oryza sativa Japonica Group]